MSFYLGIFIMSTVEPFRPEDVLYRLAPTQEERAYFGYDALIEVLVVKTYPFVDWRDLLLFGRYSWGIAKIGAVDAGVLSVLFGHLLRERDALIAEREGWIDTARKFGEERYEAEAALELVERERNQYKQALETYALGSNGTIACEVLDTCKK